MIIEIPAVALWILLAIILLLFIFFGFTFSYHWNHYGMNKTSKKVARVAYFFVSVIILFTIMFFIGLYNM